MHSNIHFSSRDVRQNESADSQSDEFARLGDSSKDLLDFSRFINTDEKTQSLVEAPQRRKSSDGATRSPYSDLTAEHGSHQRTKQLKSSLFAPDTSDDCRNPLSHGLCQKTHEQQLHHCASQLPAVQCTLRPIGPGAESSTNFFAEPSNFVVHGIESSNDASKQGTTNGSFRYMDKSKHSLQWDRIMIQVVPGYSLPLVGRQESIAAYRREAVQEITCEACQTELYCIDSASMVVCPFCRSFSPTGVPNVGLSEPELLGLGLTVEILAEELGRL